METQDLIASLALAQEAAVTYTDIDQAQDMLQIDWDTRAVTIPKSITNAGVKNDHLSKKLVLSMDRYVYGVDLANHTFAIHFINVANYDAKKKQYDECASGVYPVTSIDLSVDGKVTCEWEITNAATQIVGDVVFALHVFTIVDGAFTYHLGTTPTVLDLLNTINATEHGKNITPDEIEVYIQMMADYSTGIEEKIAAAVKDVSIETDKTLSVSGQAADAAIVGEELKKILDEIADLKYVAIQITAFNNNVGTAEIGSKVDAVTLSWTLNKTAKTITVDGEEQSVDSTTLVLSNLGLTANKTWTLKVTDEKDASATKTTSVSFLNGVYYGVAGSIDGYDSNFVSSLTKALSSTRARTITVTAGAGQYIYYCVPTRFGDCSFNVGGFDGGFDKVSTFDFANASGYTESYDVYKSTNANLGSTTVKIS